MMHVPGEIVVIHSTVELSENLVVVGCAREAGQ